jgi:hypothetical protein
MLGLPDAQFKSHDQIDVYDLDAGLPPEPLLALLFLPIDVASLGLAGLTEDGPCAAYRLHFRYNSLDRLISVEPGDKSQIAHDVAHRINTGGLPALPNASEPQEKTENDFVQQIELENKHWLYDKDGGVSAEGRLVQKYIEDARAEGIKGAKARWEYATSKLARGFVPPASPSLKPQSEGQSFADPPSTAPSP